MRLDSSIDIIAVGGGGGGYQSEIQLSVLKMYHNHPYTLAD